MFGTATLAPGGNAARHGRLCIDRYDTILLTARLPERVTLPMWLGVVVITAASAGFGGSSSGDEFPDRIQPLSESRNLLIGLAALLAIAFVIS